MFEATMTQVVVLRKIVESLKDLVTEVNIEATPTGKNYIYWLKLKIFQDYHFKLWTALMFHLYLFSLMSQVLRITDVIKP